MIKLSYLVNLNTLNMSSCNQKLLHIKHYNIHLIYTVQISVIATKNNHSNASEYIKNIIHLYKEKFCPYK